MKHLMTLSGSRPEKAWMTSDGSFFWAETPEEFKAVLALVSDVTSGTNKSAGYSYPFDISIFF